jgi:hypothetical protein
VTLRQSRDLGEVSYAPLSALRSQPSYGPYQIDGRHTAQSNEEFDITPWEACKGLMTGAERTLRSGGVLYLHVDAH